MNYEPTHKKHLLFSCGKSILQIPGVNTQHPSCYRYSSFEMSPFPADANSRLRFAHVKLLPYGEQKNNDQANRHCLGIGGRK